MANIGVMVPHFGRNCSRTALRDIAQAAEQLGFASVWTADHIVFPTTYTSKYPFSEDGIYTLPMDTSFLDCFTTMGFLSGVTERIKIGIGVCVVPHRAATHLAKLVASVDQLSEGRLIFGAGIGWLEEEFDLLGAQFRRRGALTDDALGFMAKALTDDGPISFTGKHLDVSDVYVNPGLHENRDLDVWIGGHSEAAVRRAGRFASTWFPLHFGAPPAEIPGRLAQIRAAQEAAGRSGPIDVALFVPLEITDEPNDDGLAPWEQRIFKGNLDQVQAAVREYEAAGVSHFLFVHGGRISDRIATMERISDIGLLGPASGGSA